MPMVSRALLVTALGQAFLPAFGEVFTFKSRPLPAQNSLQGLAAFSIYSPEDSPERGGGRPFVEYRNLQAHSTDSAKGDASLKSYAGLQVTLISETSYKNNIEKKGPVCNEYGQMQSAEGSRSGDVSLHVVQFARSSWDHVELNVTGTYFLLVSNCGNFSMGEITGEVAVKNPFGYLSGTDYHKMSSYVWIFSVYIVLAAMWAIMCVIWKAELIVMHGIIGFILFFCLIESGAWLGYLSTVNQVGEASDSAMCVLVMLTVLKTYTSFIFILVISQGWRMTEEVLDVCMLLKMGIFGVVFVVVSYLHEGAMTHRQSYHISSSFMVLTTVPALVVNVLSFVWIFLSLGSLSKTLKERNLDEQLQAISRFTTGLFGTVVLGSFVALVQILDSAGSLQVAWKYQFWADGGITHAIFTFMVALSMWVWMPGASSSQLGYAQPVDQNEEDGLWKEDGGDGNGHGNKVAPDTLGAQDDEDL